MCCLGIRWTRGYQPRLSGTEEDSAGSRVSRAFASAFIDPDPIAGNSQLEPVAHTVNCQKVSGSARIPFELPAQLANMSVKCP